MVKIREKEKRWDMKDSDQELPFVLLFFYNNVWGDQSLDDDDDSFYKNVC